MTSESNAQAKLAPSPEASSPNGPEPGSRGEVGETGRSPSPPAAEGSAQSAQHTEIPGILPASHWQEVCYFEERDVDLSSESGLDD